jgi:hypothetical protein
MECGGKAAAAGGSAAGPESGSYSLPRLWTAATPVAALARYGSDDGTATGVAAVSATAGAAAVQIVTACTMRA